MCDRNYKFCDTQNMQQNEPSKDSSDNNSDHKKKLKKNQCTQHTINQTCCHDGFVYNQPESFYHPNKKSSMCCRPDHKVKFQNESSTLQFPPSFNLRSDKKSTPKRTGNDSDSHFENDSTNFTPPNFTPPHQKPIALPRQSKTNNVDSGIQTTIDIHGSTDQDIRVDETFYTL